MKYPKLMLVIGIWIMIIPFFGIPLGIKKIALVIPALFIIAMAITELRMSRNNDRDSDQTNEELIHELAEEIAEDIIHNADITTEREMKQLRDIL
jgi:hypothetical protein